MKTLTQPYQFFDLVKDDLLQLEGMLVEGLHEYHPTLAAAATHVMKAGGKRLRPLMVLLVSQAVGGGAHASQDGSLLLALAIEILHTATLIHDDIIDHASIRRGLPTVNHQWDEKTSVLTGDFLMARACYSVSLLQNPRLNLLFSQTVMDMCHGEITQSHRLFVPDLTLEEYLRQIEYKTAVLMAAGCQGVGMLNGVPDEIEAELTAYGRNVGMAFQIVDDILDFSSSDAAMGKPGQTDLLQGKVTLPTYFALQLSPKAHILREIILRRFAQAGDLPAALAIVAECQALEASRVLARQYIERAITGLRVLPDSMARRAMEELADFALARSS